jgi:phospholipid-transporting ATPase
MSNREITSNIPEFSMKDNSISTSKYTCFSFIPKNLWEQFSKMANLYFLIMGLFQMIDEISTSGGYPVTYAPLSLIICISAVKDLFEDLKRNRSDREENMRKVLVLQEGS